MLILYTIFELLILVIGFSSFFIHLYDHLQNFNLHISIVLEWIFFTLFYFQPKIISEYKHLFKYYNLFGIIFGAILLIIEPKINILITFICFVINTELLIKAEDEHLERKKIIYGDYLEG